LNDDGPGLFMATRRNFQTDPMWRDHILFYEYFHGDTGAGLGAAIRQVGPAIGASCCNRAASELRLKDGKGGKDEKGRGKGRGREGSWAFCKVIALGTNGKFCRLALVTRLHGQDAHARFFFLEKVVI